MSVDELFERISKVHSGETQASVGCNLEPDPCSNWLWRLEWPDRFTLSMVDFFLVGEMGFSPAIYGDLTPYAEGNPIQTRYCEWRPLRTELGSYYSNHWFLEWMRPISWSSGRSASLPASLSAMCRGSPIIIRLSRRRGCAGPAAFARVWRSALPRRISRRHENEFPARISD